MGRRQSVGWNDGGSVNRSLPQAHLAFLVRKLALPQPQETNRLLKLAASNQAAARNELVNYLEDKVPGTVQYLHEQWLFESPGQALFIWRVELPPLSNAASLTRAITKAVTKASGQARSAAEIRSAGRIKFRAKRKIQPGEARLGWVEVRRERLEAMVYIGQEKLITLEEARDPKLATTNVRLSIGMGDRPLIRIHAAKSNARRAMLCLLTALAGKPATSVPDLEKSGMLVPITFTEGHVKHLKATLGLKLYEVGGESEGLDMNLRGRAKAGHRAELDDAHPKVVAIYDQPLDRRAVYFRVQHPDGYAEEPVVRFMLDDKQSHLTIKGRVSQLAVAEIERAVYGPSLA